MVVGFLTSGIVITKYKPHPKYLFFWNVIVGSISMCAQLSYSHLGCGEGNSLLLNGSVTSLKPCDPSCYCDGISYSPVCNKNTGETFFSPCHAGCKNFNEERNIYVDCMCSTHLINSSIETITTNSLVTTPSYAPTHAPTHAYTTTVPSTHAWNDARITKNNKSSIDKILESNETKLIKERRLTLYDVYDEELKLDKTAHDHDQTIDANDLYDESYDESQEEDSQERLLAHPDDDDESPTQIKRREVIIENFIVPGACMEDCTFAYYTFSIISLFSSLISSTGRIGNVLLNFR